MQNGKSFFINASYGFDIKYKVSHHNCGTLLEDLVPFNFNKEYPWRRQFPVDVHNRKLVYINASQGIYITCKVSDHNYHQNFVVHFWLTYYPLN